jgi:hypothetical protein
MMLPDGDRAYVDKAKISEYRSTHEFWAEYAINATHASGTISSEEAREIAV